MYTISKLNEICDIRDLLQHLNLTVMIIHTHDPESEAPLWAVEVHARTTVEGASYGTLRQSLWFPEDKIFVDDEWWCEMTSLASVIAVAMGHRVFTR
jgi:hypothetical protein